MLAAALNRSGGGLACGVIQWEPPVFEQPFELWREDGVLHMVLANAARFRMREMKEVIRLIAAMDRSGRTPVLIDHAPDVVVEDDARALLVRVCRAQGHPVVVYTASPQCQAQLDLFQQVHKPRFPFKVCRTRLAAWRWARERVQLEAIGLPLSPPGKEPWAP